jgi:hypothetical protein
MTPLQEAFIPPIVLPILISKQHAFQPLEMLVPAAGFSRCFIDKLVGWIPPLLALGSVADDPDP